MPWLLLLLPASEDEEPMWPISSALNPSHCLWPDPAGTQHGSSHNNSHLTRPLQWQEAGCATCRSSLASLTLEQLTKNKQGTVWLKGTCPEQGAPKGPPGPDFAIRESDCSLSSSPTSFHWHQPSVQMVQAAQ